MDPGGDLLQAFGVLAHREGVYPGWRPSPPYAPCVSGRDRFDRLHQAALEQLTRLVVPDPDPVTVLFLDTGGEPEAEPESSVQRAAVEDLGGAVFLTDGSAFMGWLPNPAYAIAVWVRLGADRREVHGGLAQGLAHSHDLLRATTEEAAALAWLAGPGELMIPFELTSIVDLRDARFSVERTDKGSLVPWSCRLTLRKPSDAEIRDLAPGDAEACDAIVAGLPDWFGMQEGLDECAEAVRTQPGVVAEEAGEVVGFLTYAIQDTAAEITWMAVRADRRRRGHGRALIAGLVELLGAEGVREVHVKTLSDRHLDEGYAQTRAFYLSSGFTLERELDIWGPDNPAVLLVRRL